MTLWLIGFLIIAVARAVAAQKTGDECGSWGDAILNGLLCFVAWPLVAAVMLGIAYRKLHEK